MKAVAQKSPWRFILCSTPGKRPGGISVQSAEGSYVFYFIFINLHDRLPHCHSVQWLTMITVILLMKTAAYTVLLQLFRCLEMADKVANVFSIKSVIRATPIYTLTDWSEQNIVNYFSWFIEYSLIIKDHACWFFMCRSICIFYLVQGKLCSFI